VSKGNYRGVAQVPVSEGLAPRLRHRIIGSASPIHRRQGAWRHSFIGGGVTVSSGELGHFRRVLRSLHADEGVTLSSVNMAVDRSKWYGGVRYRMSGIDCGRTWPDLLAASAQRSLHQTRFVPRSSGSRW